MLKESICRFFVCFVIANPRNLRSATNSGRSCECPLTRAYKKIKASIQLLNSESVHSRLLEMFAYGNKKKQSGAIGRAVCLKGFLLRELSLWSWIFPQKIMHSKAYHRQLDSLLFVKLLWDVLPWIHTHHMSGVVWIYSYLRLFCESHPQHDHSPFLWDVSPGYRFQHLHPYLVWQKHLRIVDLFVGTVFTCIQIKIIIVNCK